MIVLVVDDEKTWPDYYRTCVIDEPVQVFHAWRIDEAEQLLDEHRENIEVIIVDGYLGEPFQETLEFISRIRASGFTGPLIAASSSYKNNLAMRTRGCSHIAECKVIDRTEMRSIAPWLYM